MLNKLRAFLKEQALLSPGDKVIAAVSGGADSVAMLFALYLLRDELGITLEAAHFNHHLRGAESDRDEAFVTDFCGRYDIPLHLGSVRFPVPEDSGSGSGGPGCPVRVSEASARKGCYCPYRR